MKFGKCLQHAFSMVVHSRLRSWLTILGIVIGVAAVIAIGSIGTGMQEAINSRLTGMGADIVTVTAGFSRGGNMFGDRGPQGGSGGSSATEEEIVLDRTDVQALRGVSDIEYIDTQIRGSTKASYMGRSGSVSITGVDQRVWSQVTTTTIAEGRMLDAADSNVIVVGGRLASSFFSEPLGINKMLTINGSAFRVVGILDDESNSIYMPLNAAYQILSDKENGVYDSIIVKIKDEEQLDSAIAKMESNLMTVRHVTNSTKDFSVSSPKQMQATISSAMSTMSTFLVAIAAVSLIVGAVGIANTMFTSVLERTKEIGIMKAIGARNKDVLLIFLLNAGLIALVGGLIGVLFGGLLSLAIPSLLGTSMPMGRGGLITAVSMNSVIMALSVSIGIGVLAGLVPAYQASRLKPVDALRYE